MGSRDLTVEQYKAGVEFADKIAGMLTGINKNVALSGIATALGMVCYSTSTPVSAAMLLVQAGHDSLARADTSDQNPNKVNIR